MDLSDADLFKDLPATEQSRLRALATEETVPAGRVIVEEGRRANRFYLVLDGTASITVGQRNVATRSSGEWFGESAVLDEEPRRATVVADTELRLLSWRGDRLREALARNPQAMRQVLDVVRSRKSFDI